jgi:hypothetical protein
MGGLMMALAERIIVESLSHDERRVSTVDHFLDELDQMAGSETNEVGARLSVASSMSSTSGSRA